jgi:DNA-binding transcriptional MerR regulator
VPQYLNISKFAKLTGLTPRALRLYADEGLLQPEVVNPKTGYRLYSQAQAQLAERIRLLRSLDMPLGEIRTLLALQDGKTYHKLLHQHRQRIQQQISNYQETLQALEELNTRDIHLDSVKVKKVLAQPVIYLRMETSICTRWCLVRASPISPDPGLRSTLKRMTRLARI